MKTLINIWNYIKQNPKKSFAAGWAFKLILTYAVFTWVGGNVEQSENDSYDDIKKQKQQITSAQNDKAILTRRLRIPSL